MNDVSQASTLPLMMMRNVAVPGQLLTWDAVHTEQVDLIREATRRNGGLAACLGEAGAEHGWPKIPAEYGTEMIVDGFDVTPGNVLQMTLRGGRRFRVLERRLQESYLPVVDVLWLDSIDPPPALPLDGRHDLLKAMVEARHKTYPDRYPGWDSPDNLVNAEWLSWRIAGEFSFMTPERKLAVLREEDAIKRLDDMFEFFLLDTLGPDSPYSKKPEA